MFKAIDLFAGIGGIRTGFTQAFGDDIEFVFSSEINKFSCKVYEDNYGETPKGDISKIEAKDIPNFDILLGGFPCQPFSNAGLKKGFQDTTRGTLFFDVARVIDYHRPEVVFLENVKGFKSHDKGKTFEVVKNVLSDMGYNVYAEVMNSKYFGVPQNRERIFIICFKKNVDFTFPDQKNLNNQVKLGDILEDNVDEKYTISDKLWAGHQRRKTEHANKGNGFGYSLFDANSEYTSTISARYYKDGSEILIDQGNDLNPRKLTPREAARLQGFPEDFKITVSDAQAYKQFGNSVTVPVIKELATLIKEKL